MKEGLKKIEIVIPYFILIISLFAIVGQFNDFLSLKVLNSFIGVIGTILYFKKNQYSTRLIYFWIMSQLIILNGEYYDEKRQKWIESTIFDMTQIFHFCFFTSISSVKSKYQIGFNILPLFILGFYKILVSSNQVGKKLTFLKFRKDNKLGNIFPFSGIVVERVKIDKDNNWLKVNLDNQFVYDGQKVTSILVKAKDTDNIKLGELQLVYVRLILSTPYLDSSSSEIKFPFIDWAYCK